MTQPNRKTSEKALWRVVTIAVCCLGWGGVVAPAQTNEPRPAVILSDPDVVRLPQEPPARAASVLRGRVIYQDTQQPVSRAQVKLECDEQYNLNRAAVTGRDGEFVISGVGACEFEVSAEAPGALSGAMMAAFTATAQEGNATKSEAAPDANGLSVKLNGADTQEITIRLAHGGTISGRILYADGEPVTFARLTLFRQAKQGLLPFARSSVSTDDRGQYRLEEVPPGEYAVGVVDTISTEEGRGIVTVYHPAATKAQDAALVRVTPGSAAENINLQIPLTGLRRASGIVTWKRTGQPVTDTVVMLHRLDESHLTRTPSELVSALITNAGDNRDSQKFAIESARPDDQANNTFPAKTDDEGRWSAADLPAGEYRLEIKTKLPEEEPPANALPKQEDDPFEARRIYLDNYIRQTKDISLRESDAADISLELTEGSTISGLILDVNGSPPANPISVVAASKLPDGGVHDISTVSRRDGTFRLRGLPAGEVSLQVVLMGRNDGPRYVRSIIYGGVDVTDKPLLVTADSELSGLQLRLGNDFATLQGRVRTPEGQPAANASIFVSLLAEGKPNSGEDRFASAQTDAEGNFSVRLRPGEYSLTAATRARNPKDLLRATQRVTVSSGQPVTVELTLQRPATSP